MSVPPETKYSKRLNLWVKASMFLQLDVLAQKRSIATGCCVDLSDLARQAIAEFLERNKSGQ